MNAAQSIEQIIKLLLDEDSKYAITATQSGSSDFIVNNADNEKLNTMFGGAAEFFNRMQANGTSPLIIQVSKSNGSRAWVKYGTPFYIDFNQVQPAPMAPPAAPMAAPPVMNGLGAYGMGMPGLGMGLGAPEIHKIYDHPRLQDENRDLKAKNEKLTDQVAELKEKLLKNEFDTAKETAKSEKLNGLAETVISNLPAILVAMNGKASGAGEAINQGLGNPAEAMSEHKQQLVSLAVDMDEVYAPYAAAALYGLMENSAFGAELEQLLKKHQLIQ